MSVKESGKYIDSNPLFLKQSLLISISVSGSIIDFSAVQSLNVYSYKTVMFAGSFTKFKLEQF